MSDEADARLRGIAIHRLLDQLARPDVAGETAILRSIASELRLAPDDPELLAWLAEARALIADPALSRVFDPQRFVQAWNEVPIVYPLGDERVHGVIDRLVRFESTLLVIDYKTHRLHDPDQIGLLTERYTRQLQLYGDGVARLWPGQRVQIALLFTATRTLVPMALEDPAWAPHISQN